MEVLKLLLQHGADPMLQVQGVVMSTGCFIILFLRIIMVETRTEWLCVTTTPAWPSCWSSS